MSARSVGTHMRALAQRGVIVPGDPAVVEHIRGDRRPPVWDFPADLPRRPPAGGNEFQSPGSGSGNNRVEGGSTRNRNRKPPTGGNREQPRVETVADKPVTTDPGPSVGGDGRRPPTGSNGPGMGGKAASGKTTLAGGKASASVMRTVTRALPAPLADLLEQDWPAGLPLAVNEAVSGVLLDEQRTVQEIVERVERRWALWRYEDAAVAESGTGIARPLGVLLTLLAPSTCWGNNIRCEDGLDLDSGNDCPRCAEAREDKAAERRGPQSEPLAGHSVPFVPDHRRQARPKCPGCRLPLATATEPELCRECRELTPA